MCCPWVYIPRLLTLHSQIGPFYFPYMFEALNFGGAAGVMCAIVAVGGLLPTIVIHIVT